MLRNEGFTLVETLIAILLSTLLLLAFFVLMDQFERWAGNLQLMMERDENIQMAPLLLSRYVTAAGNNRWGQTWEGLESDPGELTVRSDMDGPDSFPDEALSDSFESIKLRRSNRALQLKSGAGSFQPLLTHISDFQAESESDRTLAVQISSSTSRPLAGLGQLHTQSLALRFVLRNYRPNLFTETP